MVTNENLTEVGQGYQALYHNINHERYQFAVASGCSASDGTNDQEVDIASGTVYHGGQSVSVSSQTIQLDGPDANNPRRDVIYIDANGDAQFEKGTPKSTPDKQGSLTDVFDYYDPSPPSLASTDAVVIAEVWQPAGASDWSDLNDLRTYADAIFSLATISSADINKLTSDLDADSNDINNVEALEADGVATNPSGAVDELSNRSSGTAYQNTEGKNIEVMVTAASDGNVDSTSELAFFLSPNTSLGGGKVVTQPKSQASTSTVVYASTTITVPKDWYYKVSVINGSLDTWKELK